MPKSPLMLSVALVAIAAPAMAQQTTQPGPPSPESAKPANDQGNQPSGTTDGSGNGQAGRDAPDTATSGGNGDIIVTATRRNEALSDVPLAVSAVTAASLQNSGASDIRQLNQLSPSLLVSSTSSEAGAGGARIRGIGTVGDNPGLESSVATFIDGVYRSRAGVGLTELGAIDRIEVLRGPQGTLFGRNASAGLISIITAKPSFTFGGEGEASYGNYDAYRLSAGLTGPVSEQLALRLDGVYSKRDGFLRDLVSGRTVNNRDRFLVRGQALFKPNTDLSIRIIGDYAERKEECCAAPYLPARNVTSSTPGVGGGTLIFSPSSIATLERALGGPQTIQDDTYARNVTISRGRSFRSDVRDYGISAEIDYQLGDVSLTSITAYRDFRFIRGQDADFNSLDILYRDDDGSGFTRFKTFSQELRLQGTAFNDKLNYLVGAYYADEKLNLADNLSFGTDGDRFAAGLVGGSIAGFPGFNALNPFAQGFVAAQLAGNPAFAAIPAAARPLVVNAIASQVQNTPLAGTVTRDQFRQDSRNYAFFTHNIINVTDKLSLTLGARYTNERKTLDATLVSNSQCGAYQANIARLQALAAASAGNPTGNGGLNPAIAGLATALANQVLTPIGGLPCAINSINGSFGGGRKGEDRVTGTAVLSFKPVEGLLTYASYSRGYKAGGFNLDRAGLTQGAVNLNNLQFAPETVEAFELGAKYKTQGFSFNAAIFRQDFSNFQLNTFNGINFVVENVASCKATLNGADTDASTAAVPCTGGRRAGVRSQGVELEAFLRPSRTVTVNLGATYADTKYRTNLIGSAGNAIIQPLFQLPGSRLSNSSEYVITGSAGWTPDLGSSGLTGLVYSDFRYQSALNTGSDLDPEKLQQGFIVVNARVGIRGPEQRWGIEVWAQNLLDTDYQQVGFDAPLQGSGTVGATQRFGQPSTQLFGAFLGEPRTYGVTARVKF